MENRDRKSPREIAIALGLRERQVKRYIEVIKEKVYDGGRVEVEAEVKIKKTSPLLVALLVVTLALITFAVYANVINGPFLFDDKSLVENNAFIKDSSNIPNFFKTDIFSNAPGRPVSDSYRPLQIISYAVDFFAYGNNPRVFHFTNILLHIASVLLVFLIINEIVGSLFVAYFVAFLFGIHPVNTSCVSYISGRADLLSVMFVLVSFLLYIRYSKNGKIIALLLSAVSYLFAVYSKEYAILVLPLILFLYNITFDRKHPLGPLAYIFYIIPLAPYLFMRSQALQGLTHLKLELSLVPLLPRVLTSLKTLFFDVRILLFPHDLHFARGVNIDYFFFGNNGNSFFTVLGLSVVFYFLYIMYRGREKDPEARDVFFGISWFLISMLPLVNIVPLQAFYAESWLYLPSIGIYLAIFVAVKHILLATQNKGRLYGNIFFIMICLICASYGFSTFLRNNDYLSEEKFYLSNVKHRPVVKFYVALADIYMKKHDFDNAVKYAKLAEDRSKLYGPSDDVVTAYYILGYVYMETHKPREAGQYFNMVLSSNRNDLKDSARKYLDYVQKQI